MKRRVFVGSLAALLAGCASSGGSVEAEGDIGVEKGTVTPTPDAITRRFVEVLSDSDDIDVAEFFRDGTLAHLSYYGSTTEAGVMDELVAVAGTFAGAVNQGWGVERLNVSVLRPGGSVGGRYYILDEWGRAYANEQLASFEYLGLIAETVTTE